MHWGKTIAVWMLIAVAVSIHGVIRQLFIAPIIGELPARQVGVFVASALILLIAYLTARWLKAKTLKNQLQIGAVWVVLMLIFEFSLGAVLGVTQKQMLADYNLAEGGLMGFGFAFLFFAPAIAAKLRGPGSMTAQVGGDE